MIFDLVGIGAGPLNASRARKIVLSLDKTFPKPVKQDTIFGGII